MTKCSVVMMSWTRVENVNRLMETYDGYDVVGEIIVWNNNKHFFISDLGLEKVKVLNSNVDFGLDSRFVGSLLAKNRCVIVHDDDLLLSEKNIKNLVKNFELDHTRIYTYEGRIPQGGTYTCAPGPGRIEDVSEPTEVPIALTRSTCFDRLYAAEYAKLCDTAFYDVCTNLNGEDIVFSYVTSHLSGKKPLVIPVEDKAGYVELPSCDEKISTRPNFMERRTELNRRCEILLPLPKYPPQEGKFVFFGAGSYPFAYHDDSFNMNSRFKKMLVEESNGIKYLSLHTLETFPFSVSSIRCDVPIDGEDRLVLFMFYKGCPDATEVSILVNHDGFDLESKRKVVDIEENHPSKVSLGLKDFFGDCIKNCVLKRIDFVSHNNDKSEKKLCISEVSLSKG